MNPPTTEQRVHRRRGGGFGFGPPPTPVPYAAIDARVAQRLEEQQVANEAAALQESVQVSEDGSDALAVLQLEVAQLRVDVDALMGLTKE